MSSLRAAKRIRIYVGESDHHDHKPLYQALVEALHEQGLAGATVLRGSEGFGASSRIHTRRILSLASDLPIVVECVDTPEKIEAAYPLLERMMGQALVTVERIEVLEPPGGGQAPD